MSLATSAKLWLHRHGEDVRHFGNDARSGGEVDIVEIEADLRAVGDRGIESDLDAEGLIDGANHVLRVAAAMEALGTCRGSELDGAGERGGDIRGREFHWVDGALPGREIQAEVLRDDGVVGIDGARLGQCGVGLGVVSQQASFGGLLHQRGLRALRVCGLEGQGVVAVVRIELHSAGEAALGGGEIVVLYVLGTFKVGIVGFAGLFGGDNSSGRVRSRSADACGKRNWRSRGCLRAR